MVMDHSHHGGMMEEGMPMRCSMNMLFTWDTTNLCIIFRQWRIHDTLSLLLSLFAIVALTAGYELVREITRRYESSSSIQLASLPSEYCLSN
ncbi:MAG: hypothetical protein M1829_006328 [Trizodia sp. TS-e1964]|nr:MAG: hypothetical protein M1829_006328 [Trizodia sp. TS-e1964]